MGLRQELYSLFAKHPARPFWALQREIRGGNGLRGGPLKPDGVSVLGVEVLAHRANLAAAELDEEVVALVVDVAVLQLAV